MMNALHTVDDYVDLLLSPEPVAAPAPSLPPPTPAPVPPPQPSPSPAADARAPVAVPGFAPAIATAAAHRPSPAGSGPARAGATAVLAPDAPAEQLARWLRLRCGDQTYALELLKIREVVLPAPLLPLRGVAAAVSGVMNLRGQVVPVIDLGMHFSGTPVEATAATRIVVLEERNEVLGLQVSAVEDIVLLDETRVENPRASQLAPVGDQRIRGIARFGGRVMLLLDASRLLVTPLH